MLGFFDSEPVNDPTLGQLTRRRGWWVGMLELPRFGAAELRVAGGRRGPDPRSIALAVNLPRGLTANEAEIARELYQHYLPGLEVFRSGEFSDLFSSSFPEISAADAVWPHVRGTRVEVDAAGKYFTAEIACTVAWDEEHTLGVRLDGQRVVELCGSIL